MLIGCTFALTACKQANEWPTEWGTYQGNREHTGYVAKSVEPENFTLRWSKDLQNNTSVAADIDRVYLSSSKQLYSLDTLNGNIVWSKDFSSRDSTNPPALANGKVYMQTGGHSNSFVWAYTADKGEYIFQSSYGNQWSNYYAPTVDGDSVFVAGGYYGGIYAFNATSGEQNWFFDDNQYDDFTPAVNDKYVITYTGSYNPHLIAVDRSTGEAAITIEDPDFDWNGWSMNTAPVIGSNENVVAIQSGRLISFDLANGVIGWQLDQNFTEQPSIADGVIYSINSSKLEARDEKTGNLLWVWSAESGGVSGTIVIMDNLLFVGKNNDTHAIDISTHKSVWSYSERGQLAVNQGTLYISGTQKLTAIDLVGDSDNDGIPWFWEQRYGGNLAPESDTDNDGLTALQEYINNTNPEEPDTDADGITDGVEVNQHGTSPLNADTDGDGLSDSDELLIHYTNPLAIDTDGDNVGDDMELTHGLDPNDNTDAILDFDSDGFINRIELFAGTDINDFLSVPVLAWKMQQGNAKHNGYVPVELDSTEFNYAWSYTSTGNLNTAINIDQRIFISSKSRFGDQYLKALDATDGTELWNYPITGSSPGVHSVSGPSAGNGLIYVHSGGHENTALRAFTPDTGDSVFIGEHGSQWPNYSQPTIVDGSAFVNGGYYGGMQGFNALTGTVDWSASAPWGDYWEPAVTADAAFVASDNGLSAYSLITGDVLFTIESSLTAQTLVVGSRNNIISSGAQLSSFDITLQKANWNTNEIGQSFKQPAVGNGYVYAISSGSLFVFSELTGNKVWQWVPESDTLNSNIVVTATHAFVSSSTTTYAIDLYLHEHDWEYSEGGKLSYGGDNMLLIVSENTVHSISIAD